MRGKINLAIIFFVFQFALPQIPMIVAGSLAFAQDTVTGPARQLKDDGNRLMKEKKYYEAIEKFKEAIRLKPNYFAAYNNMGNAYYWLKQYENALANYEKASQLRPEIAVVQSNLGFCYIKLNRYEEGVGILKKAVNLDNNNPGIQENLGLAYDKMSEGYYAIEYTKKAKKLYKSQGNMEMVSAVGKRLRRLYNKYGDNPSPNGNGQPKKPKQSGEGPLGTGTGFLLGASKYIITNHHVIDGGNSIFINFLSGEKIRAKVVAQDDQNDVAILKLAKRPKSATGHIVLGNSGKMEMGAKVFTIGYPASDILGRNPKYSEGTISSTTGLDDNPRKFQITVPIQPGNSGGPLFNMAGEVVGITTSSWSVASAINNAGTLPQSVNYAVKSLYITALLQTVSDFLISKIGIEPVQISPKSDLSSFIKSVKSNIVLIETAIDNSLPEFVEVEDDINTSTGSSGKLTPLKEKIRLAKLREAKINDRFKTLKEMEALEESVFSLEDKRKEVQKFLDDFPDRNPKLAEAQKMLDRLKKGKKKIKRFIPFTRPQIN